MRSLNRVNLVLYVAGALILLALFEHQALDLDTEGMAALGVLQALYGGGVALFVSTDHSRRMARTVGRLRRQLAERLHNFDPNASSSPEYFMQRLQQECERSSRYNLKLTLLVLRFNPQNGAAGTERLAGSVAADVFTHVAMAMRHEDVLGRLDSFDYGIYLPHTGREGAAIVTERLLDALQVYMPAVGVAVYGANGTTSHDLLMAALRDGVVHQDREMIHDAWNGLSVPEPELEPDF